MIYIFQCSSVSYPFCFRLFYVRNGDFDSGGPIDTAELITYIPLNEALAQEINRRISEDDIYARAGLTLRGYDLITVTSSVQPTNTPTPPTTTANTTIGCSNTEVFLTSPGGFAAIAVAEIACIGLIICSIVVCVCLRVKQRSQNQKTNRLVSSHC